jgi:hypothetical protein
MIGMAEGMYVGVKIANLQQWLTKYRILLWWLLFLPLLALILINNKNLLDIPAGILNDSLLSFQYKIFNSPVIIIVIRIALVAISLVVIMVCLFFPLFRVSKGGVQWTKEQEEELVKASGEIAGEEIDNLIKDQSFRWTLIHNWVKQKEPEPMDAHLLLRELLATLWDVFPNCIISLCRSNGKNNWGITHPLLVRLILDEAMVALEDERTYGVKLQIAGEEYLLLRIYTDYAEGFSQIDEKFILVLGEVYLQKITQLGGTPEQFLAHFDQIPLTANTAKVVEGNQVY